MALDKMIHFIRSIGIAVEEAPIHEETFLPGILIKNGGLQIDREQLLYPGDILHEAGHLAVMPAHSRVQSYGNIGEQQDAGVAGGEEMMAISWSYAALRHLQLPIELLFHPDGYKGASDWFIEQYGKGTYLALPTLQWIGLCYDEKNATIYNTQPYPHMLKWLRD
jgi:hypothetical protein